MEDGDGYAAIVALRQSKETEAIPFILNTGQPSLAGMRRGMDQGADDYLEKPFAFEAMFAAVHARLKKREAIERHVQDRQGCEHSLPASMNQDISRPLSRRN